MSDKAKSYRDEKYSEFIHICSLLLVFLIILYIYIK